MSLINGPQPKRDSAKFIVQKSQETRGIAVEKIQVIGSSRALEELRRRNRSMSRTDGQGGFEWEIVPQSAIGARRLAFGFKRN